VASRRELKRQIAFLEAQVESLQQQLADCQESNPDPTKPGSTTYPGPDPDKLP